MEETEIEDYFADCLAKLSHTLARYGKEWYLRSVYAYCCYSWHYRIGANSTSAIYAYRVMFEWHA